MFYHTQRIRVTSTVSTNIFTTFTSATTTIQYKMYLLSRRRSFHLEQIADVSGITGGFQPVSKLALNHGDFFRVGAARHFLNHVFAKSGDELVFSSIEVTYSPGMRNGFALVISTSDAVDAEGARSCD